MPPIKLLDANPHYFEFRGRPTVLVASGEHYGAVLNQDFDLIAYLDTLAACELNLTRTFAGTYRERPGSFSIVGNTLAPRPGRFLSPWARVATRDAEGERFDLTRWDEAYFRRLRHFVTEADRRGVVVELVLFCFLYHDELWGVCPMNAACNVNGVGDFTDRHRAYAADDGPLLEVQRRLVRRLVTELNEFDNVYFEIINEPYSRHDGTAFLEWQRCMIDTIVETEAELPCRHLIARNVHNRTMWVADLHPHVSILNFHYAEPSAAIGTYHLGRPVADDETGFKGQACGPYRTEAWRFMLSGGAVVSHLDYSFTVERPDGTAPIERESPSFGGPEMRRQLGALKRFMDALPLSEMAPHDEVLKRFGSMPPGSAAGHVLASPGRVYAVYLTGGPRVTLSLGIPSGSYRLAWTRPTDGGIVRTATVDHSGGWLRLESPLFADDIALRVDAVPPARRSG